MRPVPGWHRGVAALVSVVLLAGGCRKSPEDRVPDLIADLRSTDTQVSGKASGELIHLGEPAVPALAVALQDSEPRIRLAAASTLWGMGPRSRAAVPALGGALSDPQVDIRLAAAMALESAGAEAREAVPALAAALRDGDGNVRLWAAKALGAVGPAAKSAVPALVAASRNDALRSVAEESLRKIQGPAAP
jgi:HEAT repeat protein